MDEEQRRQEQLFLKAQCDKLGGRILKLQEQLAKAKYDAKRNRSAAALIREAYSSLNATAGTDEVAVRFLKLSMEHLDLDRAMILKAKDLSHIGLLHGLEEAFFSKRLPLGNELPIFDFRNGESASTPWREQISAFAEAPFWLWSWNLEKGMGLLLCRQSQDFRLRTPFDQDDRFLIEAALQVWLDILERNQAEQKIVNLNKNLERLVELRTAQLEANLEKLTATTKKVLDSIEYASRIQHALLPFEAEARQALQNSFFLWQPRDGVGGDIYNLHQVGEELVVSLFDCTGHGVPGAMVSMVAQTSLKRILTDMRELCPAKILAELNLMVRQLLRQDSPDARSNDGLDASICLINQAQGRLAFAGANLPLVMVERGEAKVIKGDRAALGYVDSDPQRSFQRHDLEFRPGAQFYLLSDGITDQVGDAKPYPLGLPRFSQILLEQSHLPLPQQKEAIWAALMQHRGRTEVRDDMTLIGFASNAPWDA